eukprot:m.33233 g.33233  ORF g.33233 m.33233 type:complete len:66 (-) comp9601_c0_seq2:209-406(-)
MCVRELSASEMQQVKAVAADMHQYDCVRSASLWFWNMQTGCDGRLSMKSNECYADWSASRGDPPP